MTTTTAPAPTETTPSERPRRRRWLRWSLIGLAAVLVLSVGSIVLFIKLQSSPAPFALPTSAAREPVGPLDGSWQVSDGSRAGFRIPETALGMSNDVVGRTTAVTGNVTVTQAHVVAAQFRVELTTLQIDGKTKPQFATALDTADHPAGTFTLTHRVVFGSAFTSGSTVAGTMVGRLELHGVTRDASFHTSLRRDGPTVEAVGSLPITLADWSIERPKGYGVFGSLADHGVVEFDLVLRPT